MKKFILIYNPLSGDAGFKHRLDAVIAKFQSRDCLLIPFRTAKKGDIGTLMQSLSGLSPDGIIVAGGDGTVHETVNAMLQAAVDLPLGIIPSGTSNDFATYLGLDGEIDRCVSSIAGGETMPVDVGNVNGRFFINVASAGLLTSVAHSADTALKNTLGKVAYYVKGLGELPHFRAIRLKIQADDFVFDDEAFLFLVMNSGTVGSFSNIAPKARINDGKLDLIIVTKCRISELAALFISLLAGTHLSRKNVIYLQAQRIFITGAEDVDSDLDGELGPKLPLEIKTLSDKLRIFCPGNT